MASGSNYLTTYYAKRIIGDTAAETATKALLQTGTGIANDIWILHRTNRANLYGIKYMYDDTANGTADRIELYGGHQVSSVDTATAWVQLDTGDVYILGRVGINYDPSDNNNTYSLYVNGTTYVYGTTYLNDAVGIGYDPETGGNTYKLYVNGDIYGNNNFYLNGKMGIGYDPATSGNTYKLYVDGNTYFDDNTYLNGKVGIGYDPNTSGNAYKLYVNGTSYFNGNIRSNGHLYFEASKNIYFNYNNKDWPVLDNYNNSNTTFNACGGGLHIGYVNTPNTYIFYSNSGSAGTKFFEVNSNGAYALTRFGVNGQNTSYTLYVNGSTYLNGRLWVATDSDVTTNSGTGSIVIGSTTGLSIGIDANEIMCRSSNAASTLYIQNEGGAVQMGAPLTVSSTITGNQILIPTGTASAATSQPTALSYGRLQAYGTLCINANTDNSGTEYVILTAGHGCSSSTSEGFWVGSSSVGSAYQIMLPNGLKTGARTGGSGAGVEIGTDGGIEIFHSSTPFIDFHYQASTADYSVRLICDSGSNLNCSGSFTTKTGNIWAGTNGNTTAERQVGVQSGAGQMYMWSHASTSGQRGIWLPGHGSGGARALCSVDTNNRVWFADSYTGTGTALAYSQAGLAASAITWLTCWNGYELRAISKAEMANAVGPYLKVNMSGTDRKLEIRMGTINVKHNTQTSVTFSPAFSNYCSAVIPWVAQLGFAAAQSVSVGSTSKTGCKLYQYNVAAVDCVLSYIAFGY